MTRVLQTVLTLHTGGLERVVIDLINNASDGYEHWICCLEESGAMADTLARRGVPLFELGKKSGVRLGLIGQLVDIIRNNGIDIVHTHNSGPAFYGGVAGRFSGVPVVHTKHGLNLFGQQRLNRVAYWFTDEVIAVSQSAAQLASSEGVPRHRLHVVDNGVDVTVFKFDAEVRERGRAALGIPPDVFAIGSLGRLSPEKNHTLLVRTFADLVADRRSGETVLLLAGDGPARAELEAQVDSLGLSDRVRFMGMLAEPHRFYPVLDAFVMPSKSEGLPVALLEAMACAVPAVVTDVGAMPRVVDGSGIVVPPEDPGQMAAELLALIRNSDQRERLAEAARRRVEAQFSVASMVSAYERFYNRLLRG